MEVKGAFDYVLVETTGAADPGPVAESLWLDDELESPLRLDGSTSLSRREPAALQRLGHLALSPPARLRAVLTPLYLPVCAAHVGAVVCVVDAAHYSQNCPLLEFSRQIMCADVVLLNKVDMLGASRPRAPPGSASAVGMPSSAVEPTFICTNVDAPGDEVVAAAVPGDGPGDGLASQAAEELAAPLLAHIRELNAGAPVVPTTSSAVALGAILNLNAFAKGADTAPALARVFASAKPFGFAGQSRHGGRSEAPAPLSVHRDAAFSALTFDVVGGLDQGKLDALLACLFWEPELFDDTYGGDGDRYGGDGDRYGGDGADASNGRRQSGGSSGSRMGDDESTSAELREDGMMAVGVCDPASTSPPAPQIYRAKGVLDIAGSDRVSVLQAVHATFELTTAGEWRCVCTGTPASLLLRSSEACTHAYLHARAAPANVHSSADSAALLPRATRLVLIGRHLPRKPVIVAAFASCRAA